MRSNGRSKPPSAKIVTPLPPVNAVKQLQRKATAKMLPICPDPNRLVNRMLRRCAALVFAKIRPAKVNSGNAGNDGLTVI